MDKPVSRVSDEFHPERTVNTVIYELRTYYIVPGRMPDIQNRFKEHTTGFFERYGITVLGFWTEIVGRNDTLVYITAFDSMADREEKWNAFQSDPEWLKVREETERNGPIVARFENRFLQSTAFSPLQ